MARKTKKVAAKPATAGITDLGPESLWQCYQKGCNTLLRNGVYFRQIVRPGLSHTYFQRALPLLQEYAAANRQDLDLPPGFRDRLDECPLSPRDLLHLDYAICLGYVELHSQCATADFAGPVMQWPGPGGPGGVFIAADALLTAGMDIDDMEVDERAERDEPINEPNGGESSPPFDL